MSGLGTSRALKACTRTPVPSCRGRRSTAIGAGSRFTALTALLLGGMALLASGVASADPQMIAQLRSDDYARGLQVFTEARDFRQAHRLAGDRQVLLFVDMEDELHPFRRFSVWAIAETLAAPEVQDYLARHFVVLRIYGDSEREITDIHDRSRTMIELIREDYRVSAVPSLLLTNLASGRAARLIAGHPGMFKDARDALVYLRYLHEDRFESVSLDAFQKSLQ